MVGITVHRKPDGITIYQDGIQIHLDKIDAARVAETVIEARRMMWQRFRLASLKKQ